MTLPALQQGKGNRREGGRTPLLSFRSEKQERHRLCLAKAPLIFCHWVECELQNLIIEKEWTSSQSSAALCYNTQIACILKGCRRIV